MRKLVNKFLRKKQQHTDQCGLPDGYRLYCIGDIHGRLDLLQQVHQKILADQEDCRANKLVVYLGDYIDRGPQSKQVVDYLLQNPLLGFESIFLLGNHEQTFLQFIYGFDLSLALEWFNFGGIATLQSYGVALRGIPTTKDVERIRTELREKCPHEHEVFYQKLRLNYQLGAYYFVHAGVKPKVSLDKQKPEDLLWIRDEFLASQKDYGKMIVHGHSVTEKPEIKPNRIALDTGAYTSGILTCAVFEGELVRFL